MMIRIYRLFSFFAIPLILLQGYLLVDHPYVLTKNSYLERMIEFKNRPHVKNIILSDSHGYKLVNNFLDNNEKTYNLANGDDSPAEMYLRLLYAIDNNPNLEYVILSIDYHMFSEHKQISSNKAFIYPFIDQKMATEVYNIGNLERILVPLHPMFDPRFFALEKERLIESIKNDDTFGDEETGEITWADLPAKAREKIARQQGRTRFTLMDSPESVELVKYYAKILEACREHDIKVIGLRFPLDPGFISQLKAEDKLKIDEFTAAMGLDRILDYTNAIPDPKYFGDSHHLNEEGGRLLLEYIRRDTGLDF